MTQTKRINFKRIKAINSLAGRKNDPRNISEFYQGKWTLSAQECYELGGQCALCSTNQVTKEADGIGVHFQKGKIANPIKHCKMPHTVSYLLKKFGSIQLWLLSIGESRSGVSYAKESYLLLIAHYCHKSFETFIPITTC